MDKKRIAFCWFGMNGRYGLWKDGLWKAMQIIETKHEVKYFDPADGVEGIKVYNPDVVLFWEAPCCINGKDGDMYRRIKSLPFRKALLFAGGPIKLEWLDGFDHVFVESKVNSDELEALGVSHSTAFGINEEIFVPKRLLKRWDGGMHGTCASWKRQWLIGEALRDKGMVVGRYQETDSKPFDECKKYGCTILPEMQAELLVDVLNQCHTITQTSDKWGGGQRCTLEALACNIPVVCMSDSPKNMEYVEESKCGLVTEPNAQDISRATLFCKTTDWGTRGRDYVMSKWTSWHYAESLLKWINK